MRDEAVTLALRQLPTRQTTPPSHEQLLTREWLVANGLGGYACGTVGGVPTRRYHGLLVAALPAPLGRTLLLGPMSELVRLATGRTFRIGGAEYRDRLELHGAAELLDFGLEGGLPVWRYGLDGAVLEKRLWMPHRHNTVLVSYRLAQGQGPVRLKLRPAVHFRNHDAPVNTPLPGPFHLSVHDLRVELSAPGGLPPLRITVEGKQRAFTVEPGSSREILFRTEESRGYEAAGDLYAPGYFRVTLDENDHATFVATCDGWDILTALPPLQSQRAEYERRVRLIAAAHPAARQGIAAELVLAADQFLIVPGSRLEEAARMQATGDEARTVIAGYHWFTDWGRDTMISLEGLTLTTGRHAEAGCILRTFANHIRDGLIPNFFPDGQTEGVYHTADATLWYFHALHRYVEATGDRATLRLLLPRLVDIIAHHQRGTRFGIAIDPTDGLLRQGAPGYQLTWMDAKVGDWVVTPRRGKAVEINALWYNALCLLRGWLREEEGDPAVSYLHLPIERVRTAFNERFWNERRGCLFDVIDGEHGDDAAVRPNQLLAISLDHPVLDRERWPAVLHVVRERLLTPVGLRSLSQDHPDYKKTCSGDLRSRDAAYHQGTVWGWLIGPYVDAWLKVHPDDRAGAREALAGLDAHLGEACIGTISEIFDAEEPYTPRGCVAQAWSVAEVLRAWVRTAG